VSTLPQFLNLSFISKPQVTLTISQTIVNDTNNEPHRLVTLRHAITMTQNKSLIFKKIPPDTPVAGEHLVIEDRPIDLNASLPKDGLLVQNLYFSFDPYQRGRMRDVKTESYSPAYPLDQPIKNSAISKVLRSDNFRFSQGDLITNYMSGNFEEYSYLPASEISEDVVWKLVNKFDLDPQYFLGPLGMPGLTAYSSFYEIGQPKKGETIFISAASGAVGSLVGQLAKRAGLKVIGSVGDDAKLDYILKDLGFDAGFNYKKESPMKALPRLAPNGIDIYYESVGGAHLEAALASLKLRGRIGTFSPFPASPASFANARLSRLRHDIRL